jgi:rubredoxin
MRCSNLPEIMTTMGETDYKKYECVICGFIYDEAEGLPDDGFPPGTRWEDLPEDWECPDCGISKADFELYEE